MPEASWTASPTAEKSDQEVIFYSVIGNLNVPFEIILSKVSFTL